MEKLINSNLLNSALIKFGTGAQINLTKEECAELIVALSHYNRDRKNGRNDVIEELADVTIMIRQMCIIFGEEDVEKIISQKMERLAERLLERSPVTLEKGEQNA